MPQTAYKPASKNRRADVRLASNMKINAAVMDQYDQPVRVLSDAQIVNVSAGGLMMNCDTPSAPGERMVVNMNNGNTSAARSGGFGVETLDCSPSSERKHWIRCRLVEGHIPASLIYNW